MSVPHPVLLKWVASRGRWFNRVIVVAAFGVLFLGFPDPVMAFLGVQRSGEAAVLFRLYGIALLSRAAEHHGVFGVPNPRAVRYGILSDLVLSTMSGAVLVWAVLAGLAGPGTWLVIGLFVVETTGYLASYAGLRGVTHADLVSAAQRTA